MRQRRRNSTGEVAVTVTALGCNQILLIPADFSVPGARGYLCVFDLMIKHMEKEWGWVGAWKNSANRNKMRARLLLLQHSMPLIRKDLDAGKDWRQEEKGTTEDEMVGWYHWLKGHELEWTPGVGDGQGGLVCCSPWGRRQSNPTERLNWTDATPAIFR